MASTPTPMPTPTPRSTLAGPPPPPTATTVASGALSIDAHSSVDAVAQWCERLALRDATLAPTLASLVRQARVDGALLCQRVGRSVADFEVEFGVTVRIVDRAVLQAALDRAFPERL